MTEIFRRGTWGKLWKFTYHRWWATLSVKHGSLIGWQQSRGNKGWQFVHKFNCIITMHLLTKHASNRLIQFPKICMQYKTLSWCICSEFVLFWPRISVKNYFLPPSNNVHCQFVRIRTFTPRTPKASQSKSQESSPTMSGK
jgi:hypothetical protein